mgnify:FL=1
MSNLLDANYQQIFPENLKKYKNLKILAIEFEKSMKQGVISKLPKLALYKNLEQQSDEVLSELAYQYSIDNWEETLSREVKINLIKNAYWAHAKKGTKVAIMENLKKLNTSVEIKEWFEYNGAPFTFKISSFYPKTEINWIDTLIEIIEKYKNSRSICTEYEMRLLDKNSKLKLGSFKVLDLKKEWAAYYNNFKRNNNMKCGSFRVIELEVKRNV